MADCDRLRSWFLCSNSSSDLLKSGFRDEDLPPTVIGVGLASFQARLAGLGSLVGYWVWLDTPSDR